MKSRKLYVFVISLLLLNSHVAGSWSTFTEYIWPKRSARLFDGDLQSLSTVPFEIGERDEKLIVEASKAMGTKLTDLDFCQQKIMLSLRSSCTSLSEEQIGKLTILLMSCQLESEGQKGYECTDEMSLAECMSSLTEDTRVLYYNLQNRAKTMCLVIRQQQFRGLAEIAVNNLMKSARGNIEMLGHLKKSQEELHQSVLTAKEGIAVNNTKLLEQQQDLLKMIETQRVNAAHNLQMTLRERNVLKTGHAEMNALITDLKTQIQTSLSHLKGQSEEARKVYNKLLADILDLQEATEQIALRLDEASNQILEQRQLTKEELMETVAQVREVNDIVLGLSAVVDNFRNDYKEKINWLRQHLGGSEEHIIKQLTVVAFHIAYLLIGMLCLIFVNADTLSRLLFLLVVFLNTIAVLYDFIQLDIATVTHTTAIVFVTKYVYTLLQNHDLKKYFEIGEKEKVVTQMPAIKNEVTENRYSNLANTTYSYSATDEEYSYVRDGNGNMLINPDGTISTRIVDEYFNDRRSATPRPTANLTSNESRATDRSRSSTPSSQQSSSKSKDDTRCIAYTARGTKCQLTRTNGGPYCRIHERPIGN